MSGLFQDLYPLLRKIAYEFDLMSVVWLLLIAVVVIRVKRRLSRKGSRD